MRLHPSMLEKFIMYKVDYEKIGYSLYDTVTVWYRSNWGFKKKKKFTFFRCFGKDNYMGDECQELIKQLKERREEIEREYHERIKDTKVPKT